MKQIEINMLKAFNACKNFSQSNTRVEAFGDVVRVFLHGNLICKKFTDTGRVLYSSAGWETVTTKSRLNALGAGITQRNFEWYTSNGQPFKSDF